MADNSKVVQELIQELSIGGILNTSAMPAIVGYNPHIWFEWTSSSPYYLIIHEQFKDKHFIRKCPLDDYKGDVLQVLPQEEYAG